MPQLQRNSNRPSLGLCGLQGVFLRNRWHRDWPQQCLSHDMAQWSQRLAAQIAMCVTKISAADLPWVRRHQHRSLYGQAESCAEAMTRISQGKKVQEHE